MLIFKVRNSTFSTLTDIRLFNNITHEKKEIIKLKDVEATLTTVHSDL